MKNDALEMLSKQIWRDFCLPSIDEIVIGQECFPLDDKTLAERSGHQKHILCCMLGLNM